jgi:hypothetical protein
MFDLVGSDVRVPTKRQCALIDQNQAVQRMASGAVRTG